MSSNYNLNQNGQDEEGIRMVEEELGFLNSLSGTTINESLPGLEELNFEIDSPRLVDCASNVPLPESPRNSEYESPMSLIDTLRHEFSQTSISYTKCNLARHCFSGEHPLYARADPDSECSIDAPTHTMNHPESSTNGEEILFNHAEYCEIDDTWNDFENANTEQTNITSTIRYPYAAFISIPQRLRNQLLAYWSLPDFERIETEILDVFKTDCDAVFFSKRHNKLERFYIRVIAHYYNIHSRCMKDDDGTIIIYVVNRGKMIHCHETLSEYFDYMGRPYNEE